MKTLKVEVHWEPVSDVSSHMSVVLCHVTQNVEKEKHVYRKLIWSKEWERAYKAAKRDREGAGG